MKPKDLAGPAAVALSAGLAAEVLGVRAFSRLVRSDVQALLARAPGEATSAAAFLEENISFQAVDATSVRVTLTDQGKTATGTLFFDSAGRLTNFVARRYAVAGKRRDLRTWSVPVTGYGEFEGLRLPTRVKAVWKLAEGDLEDINVTITDLRYNL